MLKRIIIGFITGIIMGLFGAGGGLILVPALTYYMKLDDEKSRATSVFCLLPMAIITSIFYAKNNYIDWITGIYSAIGGIVGGIIGSKILTKISDKYLKLSFVIFLIYASISMLIH